MVYQGMSELLFDHEAKIKHSSGLWAGKGRHLVVEKYHVIFLRRPFECPLDVDCPSLKFNSTNVSYYPAVWNLCFDVMKIALFFSYVANLFFFFQYDINKAGPIKKQSRKLLLMTWLLSWSLYFVLTELRVADKSSQPNNRYFGSVSFHSRIFKNVSTLGHWNGSLFRSGKS